LRRERGGGRWLAARWRGSVLAAVAATLRRDLAEADWWRLLDALLLVAACPASG